MINIFNIDLQITIKMRFSLLNKRYTKYLNILIYININIKILFYIFLNG